MCLLTVVYHGLRYLTAIVEGNLNSRMHINNSGGSTDLHISSLEMGMEEDSFLKATPAILNAQEKRQLLFLRFVHSVLAGVSYCLALLLMLVAMTYNSSLFMALVIGYAVGDFVFFARIAALHALANANTNAGTNSHGKHNGGGSGKGGISGYKYSSDCH